MSVCVEVFPTLGGRHGEGSAGVFVFGGLHVITSRLAETPADLNCLYKILIIIIMCTKKILTKWQETSQRDI